jgi:hypothetical protein
MVKWCVGIFNGLTVSLPFYVILPRKNAIVFHISPSFQSPKLDKRKIDGKEYKNGENPVPRSV